ncbi:MAG TPA: M28 family metallopeptidase, partial [Flexilinea sp.]|nr:M28 family metallopeptidase [Flexilinea sp.]
IITFPGTVTPNEQILFTAHYDSCVVFEGDPMISAPGANDNGTGVAALLEAVRIFSTMKFERTLKVIFFSGEENFQQGSKAYAEQHAEDNIIAVLNMDMFGTDKDGDRCFEMYVGELPGSQKIADLLLQTIQENRLNLKADYLVSNAYAKADQKSFWDRNIPAITVMENFLPDYSPGGCEGVTDRTDFWHLPGDKIEAINLEYAFDIGKSGILTILKLAGAIPVVPK